MNSSLTHSHYCVFVILKVLVEGFLVNQDNVEPFLSTVYDKLQHMENKNASVAQGTCNQVCYIKIWFDCTINLVPGAFSLSKWRSCTIKGARNP